MFRKRSIFVLLRKRSIFVLFRKRSIFVLLRKRSSIFVLFFILWLNLFQKRVVHTKFDIDIVIIT